MHGVQNRRLDEAAERDRDRPRMVVDDVEAAYMGLAGQLAWNRMRRVQIALQNRGVRLTFVDPERIKAQVTSCYLDVKRRQAL